MSVVFLILSIITANFGGLVAINTQRYTQVGDDTSTEPKTVVTSYLNALKELDQIKMESYLAEDVTVKSASGEESPINRDFLRNMREFEKEVKTIWLWKITSVQGNEVTVELREKNEFYDELGVSDRKQVDVYFVQNGKIYRREVRSNEHEKVTYQDYQKIYQNFKDWLSTTELVNDESVMKNGLLKFDKKNAKIIMSWLKKWNEKRGFKN